MTNVAKAVDEATNDAIADTATRRAESLTADTNSSTNSPSRRQTATGTDTRPSRPWRSGRSATADNNDTTSASRRRSTNASSSRPSGPGIAAKVACSAAEPAHATARASGITNDANDAAHVVAERPRDTDTA